MSDANRDPANSDPAPKNPAPRDIRRLSDEEEAVRPEEPEPGAGIWHAAALTVTAIVPFAYSAAAAGASAIDGFPLVGMVVLSVLVGLAATVLTVLSPVPSTSEIIARGAALVLLAFGVRFTVPAPGVAIDQLRAGDTGLITAPLVLALGMLAIAFAASHAIATGVSVLATPAASTRTARARERRALVAWWVTACILALTQGTTAGSGGALAAVLLLVSAIVSLALLADLRVRTDPPGGVARPIVTAPRRTRLVAAVLALVLTIGGGALLAPALPIETLRSPTALARFAPERWLGGGDVTDEVERLIEAQQPQPSLEQGPEGDGGDGWSLPSIPWQVFALLGLAALLLALQPHRWRLRLFRRLWRLFQRARLRGDDEALGELLALEEAERAEDEAAERGRLWQAFSRLRPRPRDPRAAVLHDYFHVERILAKEELGRESYETPHEHALRIHVSDEHSELSDLAADARFGRAAPVPAAVDRAKELRRQIERTLRSSGS